MNDLGQRTALTTDGTAFAVKPALAWTYNARGELVQASDTSASNHDRAYQYDAIGNRQKTANGLLASLPANPSYVANSQNQYTSVQEPLGATTLSPIHDLDGNATSYPVPADSTANSTLEWDAENRLIKITKPGGQIIEFEYDYLSRRISKTVGSQTTFYLYDGWNCLAEYDGSTLSKTYTWGLDLSGSMQGAGGVGGLLSVTDQVAAGTPSYYPTYDGNGNVSEYLGDTGSIAAHFEYDPFGNVIVASGISPQSFDICFSTKKRNEETGLYYYGYRYYDPVTGRWPSRDPIREAGGIGVYTLLENDGINQTDHLGLHPIPNALGIDGKVKIRSNCKDCPELLEGFKFVPGEGGNSEPVIGTGEDGSLQYPANDWTGIPSHTADALHTPTGHGFKVGDFSSLTLSCDCKCKKVTVYGKHSGHWKPGENRPPRWPGNEEPSSDGPNNASGGIIIK